jgi:RNA polymerase sigma-70 factor (ECF subfamily)
MAQVATGDARAFEVIYDRYKHQAYSLARTIAGRRGVAEEATQDAFLSLWRNAGRYDAGRGSLRGWLLTLVRNRSIDLLRREGARIAAGDWTDAALERLAAPGTTDEQVLAEEDGRCTRRLVEALPDEQRRVIALAYFGGYTQQEIARGTGLPLGTVKSRARLGLTKLREASAANAAVPLG